mmetsp:Transcript_106628/g.301602  ORF Transcript_106628/g.301602 Transcript_106628/m.301602 type:complete len:205 (+) Transcript_106628:1346-1960(+)
MTQAVSLQQPKSRISIVTSCAWHHLWTLASCCAAFFASATSSKARHDLRPGGRMNRHGHRSHARESCPWLQSAADANEGAVTAVFFPLAAPVAWPGSQPADSAEEGPKWAGALAAWVAGGRSRAGRGRRPRSLPERPPVSGRALAWQRTDSPRDASGRAGGRFASCEDLPVLEGTGGIPSLRGGGSSTKLRICVPAGRVLERET